MYLCFTSLSIQRKPVRRKIDEVPISVSPYTWDKQLVPRELLLLFILRPCGLQVVCINLALPYKYIFVIHERQFYTS